MTRLPVPELLAPAGSIDAVRAAVANGANAVYLGASMYNARDEGAQLSLDELAQACAIAHARGVRVYLTFNVLIKPHELHDALTYLGECIDRGIDAAIVQDIGAVKLIRAIYPELEIHGSTQMTVHDVSSARVIQSLGVERVVLARENTIDDVRAIREALPSLGLETFVHGALCISYSGQCLMSGMISERSANRGSCVQSCRKDYVLNDVETNATLDSGYLISAKDLAAHDHLDELARIGVGCLKVEGRKKKPEYVATVTKGYREWLERIARGEVVGAPSLDETEPLVQIFSRGNTGGMYGGRQGRQYITRTQPDNRGLPIGVVIGYENNQILVSVSHQIAENDGLGFELDDNKGAAIGGVVERVRTVAHRSNEWKMALTMRAKPPVGAKVIRTSDHTLLESARASFTTVSVPDRVGLTRLDVRVFGQAGSPLMTQWIMGDESVNAASESTLAPAKGRPISLDLLREQFGRLGGTTFVLGSVDSVGLSENLFIPVSALNKIRQDAIAKLEEKCGWIQLENRANRDVRIAETVAAVSSPNDSSQIDVAATSSSGFSIRAIVYSVADAIAAADAGATDVVLDPFLRHPAPPLSRVRALKDSLNEKGVSLRLRTPTIVRPEDRPQTDKWLALGLPILSGHLGILAEHAALGDVIADYAVNCFNQHTADFLFSIGVNRITASVELTVDELADLTEPWNGRNFDVLVYGRTEGMTIEHCVLSAAFDRIPTTCRDLCVQKHTNVSLTDPAGYTFPVATDSACRNRLLHSRPIHAMEFLPRLWSRGIRGYHLLFNVPGDPISNVVNAYHNALTSLANGDSFDTSRTRKIVGDEFTRGHFARAV